MDFGSVTAVLSTDVPLAVALLLYDAQIRDCGTANFTAAVGV